MKTHMILVTGTLGTLLSAPAFAGDDGVAPAPVDSKLSVAAQFELLPLGSAKTTINDQSMSTDAAVAYGISGMLDYAITPNISVGVAPRLVFNVKASDAPSGENAGKQLDLRGRLLVHLPIAPGVQAYAAVSPGYTIVLSGQDGVDNTTGFAIGGAAGLTYDLSPKMFIGGEVGYQRAFASEDLMVAGQKFTADSTLSYLHVGLGAGTRF
jgi:opacity protein-like surface antigen